jgi:2-polyprenyl-3-methyl-5-hydroxy-6-metoxy-1,4-benzoquinol methylase
MGCASCHTKRDDEMKADRHIEEGFSTVAAAIPKLEFTGERIVPGKTVEALFREHEERYVFAGQYVCGKDVLDVACGSGVGTSLLHGAGARRVWGLDIDPNAIAFAKARYRECEFAECEATNLCLPDGSVDVVVSFETLEHLKDQRKFLLECRRVLRPGGVLVCSTPNLEISRWSASNPYHIRELNPREFQELLGGMFPSVELFGQRHRAYLPYALRKTILQALERLRLRGTVVRILRGKSAPESFRTQFVNDVSRLRESILAYRWNVLSRPTFLIAVARVTSTHAT